MFGFFLSHQLLLMDVDIITEASHILPCNILAEIPHEFMIINLARRNASDAGGQHGSGSAHLSIAIVVNVCHNGIEDSVIQG